MAQKPKVITIANQKGGVGKTTTVANVAASLAHKNKLVLVIDCDYQANVTSLLCGDEQLKNTQKSLTQAIKKDLHLDKVVVGSRFKNIDIVPSNRHLDELREQLIGKPNQFSLIDLMLDCDAATKYDYILIDTHPSLDCFFQSAVAASNYYLIPLFPEADSSRGLAHQVQAINKVKRYLNPRLIFLGCVIAKFDPYNATHQKFEKLIRKFGKENGFNVFKANVPHSQSVAAAAALGKPLLHYRPQSPATLAFKKLTEEITRKTRTQTKAAKAKKKQKADLEIAADL